MKAKKKTEATQLPVDYSIPLLEFMRGSSKKEGLILQVGRLDKKFIHHDEEFIQKIPDLGDGLITRQVEEYWPAKHGDKNLLSALKSLAAREGDPKYGAAFQLADFRTAVEYIRKHGGPVYSNPYPQFKTYFQVEDKVYDMNYGMWPDPMNMRHDGPGIGFGQSKVLVSEELDQDDVLLVVPKQDGDQIILPEESKEEMLPRGEAIIRSRLSINYANSAHDFVGILDNFCRTNDLSLRFAMAGVGNPNEVYRDDDQKGTVTTDVIELWFPEESGFIPLWEPSLVAFGLSEHNKEDWDLARPHALLSYLQAHPDKIREHNFATVYKGIYGGEACMIVGCWEEDQERPGVYLYELPADEKERSEQGLPYEFRFLLVKKL